MMKTLFANQNLIVSIFVGILLIYGAQDMSYGQEVPDTIAEFANVNLAKAVRKELGLPTGDGIDLLKIPKAELEKLIKLTIARTSITNFTGLEHATQLKELTLQENYWIDDITFLAQLTQLEDLNLSINRIGDITPLAQLTKLTKLELWDNQISDITPLAQLTKLTYLSLSDNRISDITPLAQLTKLTYLSLSDNRISDITPLAQLTKLETLYLSENQISDITPIAKLTQLMELSLRENDIRDVTPFAGLTFPKLYRLGLKGNPIWSTYPLNAFIDAHPDLDIDVDITDAIPFPMPETTTNGSTELQVLLPELQQQPMFWINTDTDKIESAGFFDAVTQGVESLTVDRSGSKLYWGERSSSGGTIKRANFDGSNIETLVTLSSVPRGIVIDEVGNKMYWTNSDLQIQTATLNGEDINTIIQLEDEIVEKTVETCTPALSLALFFIPILYDDCSWVKTEINLTTPTDIAVYSADSRLYWTELSGRIRRVNFDGTNLETPVSDLGTPYGITVAEGKVYWAVEVDENSGKIQRANLNGTGIETLVKVQGMPLDISIDTDAGKIYWANSLGGIQRMAINGGEVEAVVLGITVPGDFVLVPDAQPIMPTTTTTDAAATTDAAVSISPGSVASPAVGEQIEFALNITGGEAVAGYQATVQFDTSALRYVSGANGDFLPTGAFFVAPKVEGNLVKLNAASLAGESSEDGTLATLTFEVIAVKASTLTLSDVLLTNSAGKAFVPKIDNAEITEASQLKGDINGDGIVNIQDLVLVAGRLGQSGANSADVNGDGIVNIQDLVLVASALGSGAAAPSVPSQSLEALTAADLKLWLAQARHLNLMDATSQRGIMFLQQLLIVLTPKETALLANYPNPFNPETWIPYQLAKPTEVIITIYAVKGTLVRTLALGHQAAGMYQTRSRAAYWDGKNEIGEKVATGVYFYTLTAGDFSATRKMLIRK